MAIKLELIVAVMRLAIQNSTGDKVSVDKDYLRDVLDYIEPKLEEDRKYIHLGDTVKVVEPMMDNRIGVVIRESDYPLFVFVLRLPDGEEITVYQNDVVKIHE